MSNHFWASGRKQSAPALNDSSNDRGTYYPHQQHSHSFSGQSSHHSASASPTQSSLSSASGQGYQPQQVNPYAQNYSSARTTSPNPTQYYGNQRGNVNNNNSNYNNANTNEPARGAYYPHQQNQSQPSNYQNNNQQSYQTYPLSSNSSHSSSSTNYGPAPATAGSSSQIDQNKPGFWNRFKSQVSLTSTTLGISKEHDGDTEDDTLIANSLVKFYLESPEAPSGPGEIPSWLNDTRAARHHFHKQQTGNASGDSLSNGNMANQSQQYTPYAQKQKSSAGATTLQEIYRKNSVAASNVSDNPMAAPAGSYIRPPVQPVNAPPSGNGRPSWVNSMTGNSAAQQRQQQQHYQATHVGNSPTAQRMRERLKSARVSGEGAADANPSAPGTSWRNKANW